MRMMAMMLAAFLAACSKPAAPPAPADLPVAIDSAPVSPKAQAVMAEPMQWSFEGVLPCADCPGIKTRLTLTRKGPGWAEGTYSLSETYIDRGAPIVSRGEWTTLRGDAADPDATVYELDPDKPDQARHFRRMGDDASLKALGRDMRPWGTGLPDTLNRLK